MCTQVYMFMLVEPTCDAHWWSFFAVMNVLFFLFFIKRELNKE